MRTASPKGLSAGQILGDVTQRLGAIEEGFIITVPPPPVRGIGNSGGFKMMIQDRGGQGLKALEEAATQIMIAGNQTAGLAGVFTLVQYLRHRSCSRRSTAFGRRCSTCRPSACSRRSRSTGVDLHQRLQLSEPDVPRDRPGDGRVPAERRQHREFQDAQRPGRDGADRRGREDQGYLRSLSRGALQPVPGRGDTGQRRAGNVDAARRWRPWRTSPARA